MKKRALSIFLLSILVISCFFYVFPLNSLAETYLDSAGCWSIASGDVSTNFLTSNSNARLNSYTYSASSSWTEIQYNVNSDYFTQLPSPFANTQNMQLNFKHITGLSTMSYQNYSLLSYDFVGGFKNYLNQLNLKSGDYLCFAQRFVFRTELTSINYSFGHIVSGNSFEPLCNIDDRFLVYNYLNVPGMTTSIGINTELWTKPSFGYVLLVYFNIAYDDLVSYSEFDDISSIVVSIHLNDLSDGNGNVSEPFIYKASLNGDIQTIEYLNSIDNNVQIISDAVQSHVAPPTNYTDFSGVDQAEAQVSSKVSSIKNTLDDWALTTYISTGLSWVGAYTSYYFNEFGFIQSIYGIIVFFAIANVLRHGFFRTQRDYVTTDNYSVKGHNTQGDYEITGTRTTRRE